MSRIFLAGEGGPIPPEALPAPTSGEVPPQTFLLADGDVFLKGDYVSLGYTHYEAFCIGAVGGDGGRVPHYRNWSYGGGGGGGGLHHVVGLLADLDAATPVVVGQPGAHGVNNNSDTTDTTFTVNPTIRTLYRMAHSYGLPGEPNSSPNEDLAITDTGARPLTRGGHTYVNADGSMVAPYVFVDQLGNVVPSTASTSGPNGRIPYVLFPNTAYIAPTDGADGGYSSFGTVCKASGGKGGKKSPIYIVYNEQYGGVQGIPGGNGGDGGAGNRTTPGGGGAGASSTGATLVPAVDGTWDGSIGKGGGGGRGGTYIPGVVTGGVTGPSTLYAASNGGQGSFNFGDPSAYGPRGQRDDDPDKGVLVVPGTGGGAKLSPLLIYGSRAPGANPEGAVFLRLTQVV